MKEELLKQISSLEEALSGLDENSQEYASLIEDINSIKSTVSGSDLNTDLTKSSEDLNSVLSALAPELEERAAIQGLSDAEAQKRADLVNTVSNIATGVSAALDLNRSNKQISQGKQSLEEIAPFRQARPFKRSDELARRIRETRQEGSATAINRQTKGLEQDIEDQFQTDINQASILSGGQASTRAALGQVASRNKIRNLIDLQGLQSKLRNQSNRDLNFLASQQISENQSENVAERARAELDFRRNQAEQQAAGNLIQAGNINQRNSTNQLLSLAPSLLANFAGGGGGGASFGDIPGVSQPLEVDSIGIPGIDISPSDVGLSMPENINPRTGVSMQERYDFSNPYSILDFEKSFYS